MLEGQKNFMAYSGVELTLILVSASLLTCHDGTVMAWTECHDVVHFYQLSKQLQRQSIIMHVTVTGHQQQRQSLISNYLQLAINT